jgi:threonine synthase
LRHRRNFDVQYDYAAVGRILTRRRLAGRSEQSHWRYRELLPIGADAKLPALSVGGTPLTNAPALARHLGIAGLFLKDDGRNATGWLKDRASSVGVVKVREKRRPIIACASTRNAASSCAGMAASMGLKSVIFVPERAPEPKVTQLLIFGATVLRVRGSHEDAFQLCQRSCEKWGWYNRNSGINPYLVEGKKTAGLEIGERLAWEPTHWVAVSVGDGCTVAAVWKGFRELKALGLILRTPRITVAQARAWLVAGEFPAGSMGPKIEAAIEFVEGGGEECIITCTKHVAAALTGETGTHIVAS